jgi:Uma2 family endonuclease
MRIKVVNYLRAGTTLWMFDPDRKQVEVYSPKYPPITVSLDGVLDGGDVLPGFSLSVREIFTGA